MTFSLANKGSRSNGVYILLVLFYYFVFIGDTSWGCFKSLEKQLILVLESQKVAWEPW